MPDPLDITLTIPTWAIAYTLGVWLGMGLLCWPVVMVRYHHMMGHNVGWTWRTTLAGRPNPAHPVRHAVRVLTGHVVLVLAWPIALHEARPRPRRYRRTIERRTQ